jgi:hypothetical protein
MKDFGVLFGPADPAFMLGTIIQAPLVLSFGTGQRE